MAVDAAVALGAGTALALGAALVVLGPLWKGDADPPPSEGTPERGAAGEARAEGVSAVEALREIEFDRATGKLSDDDYAALKTAYTRDALAELRAADGKRAGAAVAVAAPVGTDRSRTRCASTASARRSRARPAAPTRAPARLTDRAPRPTPCSARRAAATSPPAVRTAAPPASARGSASARRAGRPWPATRSSRRSGRTPRPERPAGTPRQPAGGARPIDGVYGVNAFAERQPGRRAGLRLDPGDVPREPGRHGHGQQFGERVRVPLPERGLEVG
jgi:hypothetical protein